ncbi:hypothetical protein BLNAU_23546 [Blattamonas nauphoetae]|uniref:Uncharacterized protein n=1 Tax=Blattamonas nauphoetae TaxID=2049346 RepID=A0ABQ9WPW9_9EUKA|nr:hypothetical protein BLNAU_23546 [Blattamonas nauphoetae]
MPEHASSAAHGQQDSLAERDLVEQPQLSHTALVSNWRVNMICYSVSDATYYIGLQTKIRSPTVIADTPFGRDCRAIPMKQGNLSDTLFKTEIEISSVVVIFSIGLSYKRRGAKTRHTCFPVCGSATGGLPSMTGVTLTITVTIQKGHTKNLQQDDRGEKTEIVQSIIGNHQVQPMNTSSFSIKTGRIQLVFCAERALKCFKISASLKKSEIATRRGSLRSSEEESRWKNTPIFLNISIRSGILLESY